MPVANSQQYIIGFSLPGGEKAAMGWWGPLSPAEQSAQADADTLAAAASFTGFMTRVMALNHSGVRYVSLSVRQYGASGQLTDVGSHPFTSGNVGSGTPALPNQCALAITMQSANRTRSGRGRSYMPCTATTISTTTGAGSGDFAGLAQAFADLCDSTDAAVASEKLGQLLPVTTILVGNIVDTQRRRRDKLVESRVSATV